MGQRNMLPPCPEVLLEYVLVILNLALHRASIFPFPFVLIFCTCILAVQFSHFLFAASSLSEWKSEKAFQVHTVIKVDDPFARTKPHSGTVGSTPLINLRTLRYSDHFLL